MGCDIHMAVEIRRDGVWLNVPEAVVKPYGQRNYGIFAMLADVRNDGGVPYISRPRGVPQDAAKASINLLSEEHSASWVLLSEVQGYLAAYGEEPLVREGFVSLAQFDRYRKTGQPDSWCGAVAGPNVQIVSVGEAQALIARRPLKGPTSYYVQINWIQRGVRLGCFGDFVEACAKLGPAEQTRLVFDFDS
jgi:hypothetical protein